MKNISFTLLLFMMSVCVSAQLPDFNFTDTEGKKHNFYDLIEQGELVVLDFYFVGCGACIDVAKRLHNIDEKYGFGTEGVKVLAMEVQNNPLTAVLNWEDDLPGTYPVLYGDGPWNYWYNNIFPDFGGAFPELALIKGDANNPANNTMLFAAKGEFGLLGQMELEQKIEENLIKTSIVDINKKPIVELVNNPARGFLNFEFSSDLQGNDLSFELMSLDGKIIMQWAGLETQKDISRFTTGQYLLNIKTKAESQTLKIFIVQ